MGIVEDIANDVEEGMLLLDRIDDKLDRILAQLSVMPAPEPAPPPPAPEPVPEPAPEPQPAPTPPGFPWPEHTAGMDFDTAARLLDHHMSLFGSEGQGPSGEIAVEIGVKWGDKWQALPQHLRSWIEATLHDTIQPHLA